MSGRERDGDGGARDGAKRNHDKRRGRCRYRTRDRENDQRPESQGSGGDSGETGPRERQEHRRPSSGYQDAESRSNRDSLAVRQHDPLTTTMNTKRPGRTGPAASRAVVMAWLVSF